MPTPKAVPPDNTSFAPRLKTIVKPPDYIAEALQVQATTAKRIYEGFNLVHASTRQASESANAAATEAIERSELSNQALIDVKDLLDALGDFITTQRIGMDNVEEYADSIGGARMWVSNFLTAYVYQHPPTMAEILNGVNPTKLTIAAKEFMTVERVLVIIDALLAAWPVEVFQHILIKAAGQPVERVLVIVKALLVVQPVAIIEHILASASLTDFDQAARGVKNVRLGKVIHELMKSAQKWGL